MTAASMSRAQPADAATTMPEWVVFACEDRRFAVPVERLRQILEPRSYVRLPGCGAAVCGLIDVRGRVVTAFDFGAAMALRPSAERPEHRLLLTEHDGRSVALAVERVLGVVRSETGELSVSGAALGALDAAGDDVIGVGDLDGRPFVAVDPSAVVDRLLA